MLEKYFKDRYDAGRLLAEQLKEFAGQPLVVYGLARGGVVIAYEIAHALGAPLEIIIVRKIGHPYEPEFALGAVAEDGDLVGDEKGFTSVDQSWLQKEITHQRLEAKRRREVYLKDRPMHSVQEKIVILADDGVATGYTLRLGITELQHQKPKKIIVAVPIIPESIANIIKPQVDKLVALEIPEDNAFFGAVGAYYTSFLPVEDEEVIDLLQRAQI